MYFSALFSEIYLFYFEKHYCSIPTVSFPVPFHSLGLSLSLAISILVTLNNFSEMSRKLLAFMQTFVLPKAAIVFGHVLYVVDN